MHVRAHSFHRPERLGIAEACGARANASILGPVPIYLLGVYPRSFPINKNHSALGRYLDLRG